MAVSAVLVVYCALDRGYNASGAHPRTERVAILINPVELRRMHWPCSCKAVHISWNRVLTCLCCIGELPGSPGNGRGLPSLVGRYQGGDSNGFPPAWWIQLLKLSLIWQTTPYSKTKAVPQLADYPVVWFGSATLHLRKAIGTLTGSQFNNCRLCSLGSDSWGGY